MLGYVQMPKVFLLRSLALLLVGLVSLEWALSGSRSDAAGWMQRWARARAHPARMILLATIAVLAANFVSLLLSPVRTVAFWGNNPGLDTYGLYSVFAYLVFFAVLATKIRDRGQIERLLWTLTAASIVVSVYGIAQHFGFDPLKAVAGRPPRPDMSFGNPIFGAAYLIMTMPLTVAALMIHRGRMSTAAQVALGGGLLATPLTAVVLTLSRGPWVGGSAGIIVFLIAITWLYGWREARRPVGMIAIAAAIPLIVGFVPATNASTASLPVLIDRISSIGPALSGGVSDRAAIWQGGWRAATGVRWVDTERFPELPSLMVPALRPFIGYGQDTFGYAFTAAGGTTSTSARPSHAHNFLLHTAVELGALGVAAYISLFVAVMIVLLRLLYRAKQKHSPYWFNYLVVALIAVVVARGIEQMAGKAQVSDLHLMWMLAAVVVALPTLMTGVSTDRAATAGGGGQRTANRRPARRDSRAQTASTSWTAESLIRWLVAGTLILVVVFIIWPRTVLAEVRAAVIAQQATEFAQAGDERGAIQRYLKAIDVSPSAPAPRLFLAHVLFTLAQQENEPTDQRIGVFKTIDELVLPVLERNPLEPGARRFSADYLREWAVLQAAVKGRAILASETFVELMPGYWQPRTDLAKTLGTLGEFEEALRAIQGAKEIGVVESPGAMIAYYADALAFYRMGRFEESQVANLCSMAHQSIAPARELADLLRQHVDPDLDRSEAGRVWCPEVAIAR